MIRVLFVCLGNICRSPMAEAVFRQLVAEAGLQHEIVIDSAGTGRWHLGEPAHRGTRAVLRRHEIHYDGRAPLVTVDDLRDSDYVIAMDSSNVADLEWMDRERRLAGKLYRLLDFGAPDSPADVPDPYYEGNFAVVYELVSAACRNLLDHIRKEHGL